ncbi:hypothetical protein FE783_35135 [Paenibacillus mesophilus]|uniref:hypothetical protein n=1 Tax=Paenibacillus mesophilus TaxID=2582849 RepID=UPI00110E4A34|nr:hypothetical protein [Paenibacillus mesophilus]TMV43529.1 hypothetical protein FE783_35135 [Paenibacillus mesophilus]
MRRRSLRRAMACRWVLYQGCPVLGGNPSPDGRPQQSMVGTAAAQPVVLMEVTLVLDKRPASPFSVVSTKRASHPELLKQFR